MKRKVLIFKIVLTTVLVILTLAGDKFSVFQNASEDLNVHFVKNDSLSKVNHGRIIEIQAESFVPDFMSYGICLNVPLMKEAH